jgi:hypothetical protein
LGLLLGLRDYLLDLRPSLLDDPLCSVHSGLDDSLRPVERRLYLSAHLVQAFLKFAPGLAAGLGGVEQRHGAADHQSMENAA